MQLYCSNEVMADSARDRAKFNLQLPVGVMEAFDTVADRYGHGKRWMVLTAGITLFLGLPKEKQDELMKRVSEAEIDGNFSTLVPLRIHRIKADQPAPKETDQGL